MEPYTRLGVIYIAWPQPKRPYRLELQGEPVWAHDRRGRRTYVETQPTKLVSAHTTATSANAAGERAAAKYGLPFKPWTVGVDV